MINIYVWLKKKRKTDWVAMLVADPPHANYTTDAKNENLPCDAWSTGFLVE